MITSDRITMRKPLVALSSCPQRDLPVGDKEGSMPSLESLQVSEHNMETLCTEGALSKTAGSAISSLDEAIKAHYSNDELSNFLIEWVKNPNTLMPRNIHKINLYGLTFDDLATYSENGVAYFVLELQRYKGLDNKYSRRMKDKSSWRRSDIKPSTQCCDVKLFSHYIGNKILQDAKMLEFTAEGGPKDRVLCKIMWKNSAFSSDLEKNDHLEKESTELEARIIELKMTMLSKWNEVQALEKRVQEAEERLLDKIKLRRQAHGKLLDEQGNIRVFCRCRPVRGQEASADIKFGEGKDSNVVICLGEQFALDHVFGKTDGQDKIFEKIAPYVTYVLDGHNTCLFAYGHIGSGKTYTMEGLNNDGLYYKTCLQLFEAMNDTKGVIRYEIRVSVMEVYEDTICDLAAKQTARVDIYKDNKGQIHIAGLTEKLVSTVHEALDVIKEGTRNRNVGSTAANVKSSRSHCLVLLKVAQMNSHTQKTIKSKLWLVDLAGSKRRQEIGADKDRLKDSDQINLSLFYIGEVIAALARNDHPPYRNCKLTRILEDSLGMRSKTLMLVHISDSKSEISETVRTLKFAVQARGVKLLCASPRVKYTPTSKKPDITSRRCTVVHCKSPRNPRPLSFASPPAPPPRHARMMPTHSRPDGRFGQFRSQGPPNPPPPPDCH